MRKRFLRNLIICSTLILTTSIAGVIAGHDSSSWNFVKKLKKGVMCEINYSTSNITLFLVNSASIKGKSRASKNAIKHGILSKDLVVSGEKRHNIRHFVKILLKTCIQKVLWKLY